MLPQKEVYESRNQLFMHTHLSLSESFHGLLAFPTPNCHTYNGHTLLFTQKE